MVVARYGFHRCLSVCLLFHTICLSRKPMQLYDHTDLYCTYFLSSNRRIINERMMMVMMMMQNVPRWVLKNHLFWGHKTVSAWVLHSCECWLLLVIFCIGNCFHLHRDHERKLQQRYRYEFKYICAYAFKIVLFRPEYVRITITAIGLPTFRPKSND